MHTIDLLCTKEGIRKRWDSNSQQKLGKVELVISQYNVQISHRIGQTGRRFGIIGKATRSYQGLFK